MKKIISCLLAFALMLSAVVFIPAERAYAASDNIALGKPTTASSTGKEYKTENIVDGDYRTLWVRGNYGSVGEWVQVDLEDTYVITSMVLHTRLDATDADPNAYKYRTKVDVWLSNDPNFETYDRLPGLTDKDAGYGVPVTVKPPKKAYRYVRLAKTDAFIFVFAELEVFGYPASATADMAPEYEDVVGGQYENPVTLLESLGAIKPMSETQFGVNNLITRGQAAELVVDTFMPNSEYTADGNMPFADVEKDSIYYNAISSAYSLGYIMGGSDAKYNPDDFVTPREFATMVLRAMGYGTHLQVVPNREAAITDLTRKLDLFKNVDEKNTQLNIGDGARILYNALMAKYLTVDVINENGWEYRQSEEPMIEDLYNLKIYEGVVNETRKFNLVGDEKAINNTVRVGNQVLNDPKGKLDGHLGKDVMVVVYNNSINEVSLALVGDDNVLATVKAEHIDEVTETSVVEIDENSKKKTYRLASGFDVVYNGEPYTGFTATDLAPKNGTVTFLDNNDDGKYEVVFVDEYEAYYVSGSYSDEKSVTFVDENRVPHTFDTEYLTMQSSEGYPAMASGLKNGVVAKVFKGKTIGETRIVLFADVTAKGAIKSVLADGVVINGNTYKFAFGYSDLAAVPALGKNVSVFVDENGEIFWMHEILDAADTQWQIGFCVTFAEKGLLNSELQFKIFTEKGVFVLPYVAERITVDGQRMKNSELSALLGAGGAFADFFRSKLLRFRLNEDGELVNFDTLNTTEAEMGITFKYDGHIANALFSSASQSFWNYQEFVAMATSDTPVFIIPTVKVAGSDTGVFTADPDYDSMYQIRSVVAVVGDRGYQDQNVDMYMKNEEGYPACFMRTAMYSEATGDGATTVTDSTAPFLLVKEAVKTIDGYTFSGFNIQDGKEVSFSAPEDVRLVESGKIFQDKGGDAQELSSPWFEGSQRRINAITLNGSSASEKAKYIKELDAVDFGDILRYEVAGGQAKAVERVFEFDSKAGVPEQPGNVWLSVEGNYPQFFLGYNRFQLAKFTGYSNNVLNFEVKGNEEMYHKTGFKYVFSVEPFRRTIEKQNVDGLYAYTGNNYRTMIYTSYANPVGLIIYEY